MLGISSLYVLREYRRSRSCAFVLAYSAVILCLALLQMLMAFLH